MRTIIDTDAMKVSIVDSLSDSITLYFYDVITDCFSGKSAAEIIDGPLADPFYQAFAPVEPVIPTGGIER